MYQISSSFWICANSPRTLTNLTEMQVSDQTNLSHAASLPAVGIIEAAAIIKVADIFNVAAIIKVAAIEGMTVGLHTTPILDADKVILNKDPIPGILPTLIHPEDILTGLNLCPDPAGGVDLILAAKSNLD